MTYLTEPDDLVAKLTKREYFAARALQGLCADPGVSVEEVAALAIEVADSLIENLNTEYIELAVVDNET